ncbi:MAG TPA: FecR domain-containing protein [Puia sp.]|uniref:FecR family protein n=1 Tax=Puia sp. TaxID=2045100 RepID=UPI002B724B05|nr:FecR domain-containing protein [Puia sp.]HVU96312.1 FecR domain-containing protein [Puia sp.]
MITEELIIKFFEGKCNAQEVAIVTAWLNENPANLKKYIGEEEWENFQATQALLPEQSGKLWNNIYKNATPPVTRHSRFRWTAVAASFLLVAGLSWLYHSKGQKTGSGAATAAATTNVSNTTPQNKRLSLPDGSTVELSPNSTLSYADNFNSLKREVVLNGEAVFTIAKDAAKPFSVSSHSILVTVLGTRFTVNSYEAGKATKVILHEGRVMVKIPDSSVRDNKNEYYLAPGDIFIFKKVNKGSAGIKAATVATSKSVSIDSISTRVLHLEEDKDNGYLFDNYPLDVVFDQLQIIYNTPIIYNKADLGNRTFIGKIDKKDSLSDILKSITLLNKFRFHRQGDSLIISN